MDNNPFLSFKWEFDVMTDEIMNWSNNKLMIQLKLNKMTQEGIKRVRGFILRNENSLTLYRDLSPVFQIKAWNGAYCYITQADQHFLKLKLKNMDSWFSDYKVFSREITGKWFVNEERSEVLMLTRENKTLTFKPAVVTYEGGFTEIGIKIIISKDGSEIGDLFLGASSIWPMFYEKMAYINLDMYACSMLNQNNINYPTG